MRAKSKWAIALLILQLLSVFRLLNGIDFDAATILLFSLLYEQIPTIGAIILIFYNHKYAITYKDKYNLLQKWILALVWIQPVYSFLSCSLTGSLSAVLGQWIGSCLFPLASCLLLCSDWKLSPATEEQKTQPQEQPQQIEIQPEEKKEENSFLNSNGYLIILLIFVGLIVYLFFSVLKDAI